MLEPLLQYYTTERVDRIAWYSVCHIKESPCLLVRPATENIKTRRIQHYCPCTSCCCCCWCHQSIVQCSVLARVVVGRERAIRRWRFRTSSTLRLKTIYRYR